MAVESLPEEQLGLDSQVIWGADPVLFSPSTTTVRASPAYSLVIFRPHLTTEGYIEVMNYQYLTYTRKYDKHIFLYLVKSLA